MALEYEPPTQKQLNYIDILVIDLNFTIKERNFYMSKIAKRNIKAPDELTKMEAGQVISRFKAWKEQNKISELEAKAGGKYDPSDDDWWVKMRGFLFDIH